MDIVSIFLGAITAGEKRSVIDAELTGSLCV